MTAADQKCPPNRRSQLKCDESCPFFRVGLPIFPARYAVVLNNEHSPVLTGDLLAPELADKPLGASARYGARLLRPGYLYLYDEKRNKLEGYFANADGTLYKFDIDKPMTECESTFGCTMDHQAAASMITIPNAKRATNVWLTYSDTQWTKDTVDLHKGKKGAEWRAEHMFCLNVPQWLASKKHANASSIKGLKGKILDYAVQTGGKLDFIDQKAQLDWSTVGVMSTQAWMGQMIEDAAQAASPDNGMMLVLPDPTGITQDLARLMRWKFENYVQDPQEVRQLTVSKSIESLREMVGTAAESDFLRSRDVDAANTSVYGTTMPNMGAPGGGGSALGMLLAKKMNPEMARANAEQAEALRHPSEGERQAAKNKAWAKYQDKYDENARATWQQGFNQRLQEFDKTVIVPLAKAHVAWMESQHLVNSFKCNYDPKDIDSGEVYLTVFTLCVDGTQNKQACFTLYERWTMGAPTDTSNIMLRAMFHNQDLLADKVQEATATTVDWKTIPWGNLNDIYKNAFARLAGGKSDRVARLVEQMMGPLTRILNLGVDNEYARKIGLMMGVIAQKPTEIVSVTGSKKSFRAALIRELVRQNGGKLQGNALEKAVADQLRRLEVKGEDLGRPDNKKFFSMRVDSDAISEIPANASPQDKAKALAAATMTVEQYEAREMQRWRTVITSDVRMGIVGCLFQTVALTKLWKDTQTAMPHESKDASYKFVIGVGSAAASGAEVIGNIMAGKVTLGLRFGRGLAVESAGTFVAKWAGRAGIFFGVLMAAFDIKSGYAELTVEQNGLMGGLYLTSAGLSLLALAAFAFAPTVVGLVLVALLFVVVILIEVFKDNKVQDWLERAWWGKFQNQGTDYYYSLNDEMKALRIALGEG